MKKISNATRVLLVVIGSGGLAGCLSEPEGEGEPLEEETAVTEQSITCSGNGCNGVDPNSTPCASGATTVQTRDIYRNGTSTKIGFVELRWSSSCGTNWSRVTRIDGAYAEAMSATVTRSDGLSYFAHHTGFTTIWSPMVYAPVQCATADGLIDQSWTSGSNHTDCL